MHQLFGCQIPKCQSEKGGNNGAKSVPSRSIRAVCRALGSDFHRLLEVQLKSSTGATASSTFYHFVPHLSVKSFNVKQKLVGTRPTPALIGETTMPCAVLRLQLLGVVFRLMVLSLFVRLDFS